MGPAGCTRLQAQMISQHSVFSTCSDGMSTALVSFRFASAARAASSRALMSFSDASQAASRSLTA